MELDSKNLGRLRPVANPRDVWTTEAGDFTPWLAENIDELANELGIPLTVIGTEVPVGDFRLDIRAESDGRVVIIENQLDKTDHGHLGQCLVYAAGLDAAAVVWVAPQFREDYRQTFDWLNERTDVSVGFFGVEVGVVQIGDGPRAPVFRVVSRPNNWQKAAKSAGTDDQTATSSVSATNATRQDFFAEVLTEVIAVLPAIRMPARSRTNWIAFSSGPFGYWAISIDANGRVRLETYIDTGNGAMNNRLFDEFFAAAQAWEARVGLPLTWERLDGRRASRIASYREVDIDDPVSRTAGVAEASRVLVAMHKALNDPLRDRGKAIRAEVSASSDAAVALAHEAGLADPGL